MISDFHVKGYRGFQQFELERLTRVNVLVGKNNAGKTSLLEAMQLVSTGVAPLVVQGIAMRRGELIFNGLSHEDVRFDMSHFFLGHRIADGGRLEIGTEESHYELAVSERQEVLSTPLLGEDTNGREPFQSSRYTLKTIHVRGKEEQGIQEFHLTSEGGVQKIAQWRVPSQNEARSLYILPEPLSSRLLTELWNRVIVSNEEAAIVDAIRVLEPRVKSIAFLSAAQPPAKNYMPSIPGILIGLEGEFMRVPLGSLGDGMKRLLTIALAVATMRDGVVLIDEVDTGLHYSVMKDLWRLIIKTAVSNNVQVFASTHSLDCLRGLQVVQEEGMGGAEEIVSIHTINPEFPKATRYGTKEIPGIIKYEIEVR